MLVNGYKIEPRANLSKTDLREANLSKANLREANLSKANLYGANLSKANLREANLREANLRWVDLRWADLREADLYGANLRWADLREADLYGANLRWAQLPSPTMILLASWGKVSDELCVQLMRYDAACHPDPIAFDRWVDGGGCPYESRNFQRAAGFEENRELWSPGKSLRPYELMVMVLEEKCIWDEREAIR
jgi:hypothetical protein